MSEESCFAGPTKPGLVIYALAFDAAGALYMLDSPGLAVHRRGEKKASVLGGPELGGTRGLSASRDLVAVGGESSVSLVSAEGALLATIAGRPAGVAVSEDGAHVAIGRGEPGAPRQSVEVWDRAGQRVLEVDDEAVRNGTEGLVFTRDGARLLLVAGGKLVTIERATGAVRVGPPLREELQLSARRMASLGDAAKALGAKVAVARQYLRGAPSVIVRR